MSTNIEKATIKPTDKEPTAWRKWTFVLAFILIATAIFMILGYQNPLNPQPDSSINYSKDICSQIEGTPAWLQDGKIIGYGEGFPERYAQQSFVNVVDYLIENKITFVYDSRCIHCQNEIKHFGDSWERYQQSGFVIQCDA